MKIASGDINSSLRALPLRLPPLPQASVDRILNGAARELWPTIWPTIADMLAKRK